MTASISATGNSPFAFLTTVTRPPAGRAARVTAIAVVGAAIGLVAAIADTDLGAAGQLVRDAVLVALAVVALWAVRRHDDAPSRRRAAAVGAAALLLGSLATAAGAMTGAAALAVEGPSIKAAFGFLGLAGGLVLLAVSVLRLVGALPGWWRLAALPVAFVVVQFWLMPVVMAMLGTHAPRPAFTATVPAGAERVAFHAADGVELVGWYTPSTNGATIVVLAGAGGTKADTRGQAAVLIRHGYGVLAVDARGAGESGGHPMLWGWGGDADLRAAVDYLVSRPGVDRGRIGALGESMGAEVALTGAASDPRLRAVVAEGATARTCADLSILPNDMKGVIHRADSCLGWSLAAAATGATEPAPLADEIRRLGRTPVLLIAADLAEEHAATEAWRAAAPETIRLWEPANTGHTAGLSTQPAEWERRVIEFLDAAL